MNNNTNTTNATVSANAIQPRIRFVSNIDGGPYAKRRRINSACLSCRRRKTRCSGERPSCGTCVANKHQCEGYGEENAADAAPAKKKIKQENAPQSQPRPSLPRSSSGSSTTAAVARVQKQDGENAPSSTLPSNLTLRTRNRTPFFRYFGPTAIQPGFKQMLVKVRGKTGHTTSDPHDSSPGLPSVGSPSGNDAQTPMEIPLYDTSAMSPSPLITHLCKLFFVHLGCSFPFLQRERFLRDLEEKQVDAILVDAVCALAARFSNHPVFTGDAKKQNEDAPKMLPSEYGQAFAQRAKSAIPDTFPCPNVAVVQAALLLAYDEFGANRDSGLWMYLGIAIRMAQDLGMQTLEGLRYEGRDGPTPRSVQTNRNERRPSAQKTPELPRRASSGAAEDEQRAVERERVDTWWSIFLLDRIISSGTGRPVTLRDKDIELSFPSLDEVEPVSGWPQPFPALIRIVHLYGRVTDLLNSIKDNSDITDDLRKQLDTLEYHLTDIYQNLSPRLHFNAVNFQQYVKLNEGTNFLMLHCWFHTLIVLLHQPTLLKTFEGSSQPLSSNSRELSMSSAKTVADILAFTDLIDAKTGVGNPFTSQPIYIAACAFLKETALHSASSQPHSRPASPGPSQDAASGSISLDHMTFEKPSNERSQVSERDQKQAAKHTLLATAANQNYQRCYRALKSLETHWAGVKYILTVLEQKAKGVGDPLLYTREEMESALEAPRPEPSFTSPGWRRKLSWGTYLTTQDVTDVNTAKLSAAMRKGAKTPIPGSPMNTSQAIGWSLTGTMNSPSTNVAVMYSSENGGPRDKKPIQSKQDSRTESNSVPTPLSQTAQFEPSQSVPTVTQFSTFDPTSMPPPPQTHNMSKVPTPDPVMVSDADLLLNLHSPFSAPSPNNARGSLQLNSFARPASNHQARPLSRQSEFSPVFANYPTPTDQIFGDMVIDSQEVDVSVLGADVMPWDLEYLPHDMLYFGENAWEVGGASVGNDTGPGAAEG